MMFNNIFTLNLLDNVKSSKHALPLWEFNVTCHQAEVTFPPLSQPIKAGT